MTAKQQESAPAGTVTKDPELVALTKVERTLAALTPGGRQRVLRWILSKPEYAALGGDCRAAGFAPKAEPPAVQP